MQSYKAEKRDEEHEIMSETQTRSIELRQAHMRQKQSSSLPKQSSPKPTKALRAMGQQNAGPNLPPIRPFIFFGTPQPEGTGEKKQPGPAARAVDKKSLRSFDDKEESSEAGIAEPIEEGIGDERIGEPVESGETNRVIEAAIKRYKMRTEVQGQEVQRKNYGTTESPAKGKNS